MIRCSIRSWQPAGFTLSLLLAVLVGGVPASAEYEVYRANLHVHTRASFEFDPKYIKDFHDFVGELDHIGCIGPGATLTAARWTGLDVLGLSDHGASIDGEEWSIMGDISDSHQSPGDGVVLRGFEWTLGGMANSDHVNVFGTEEWADVSHSGSGTPSHQFNSLPALYAWLEQQPAMAAQDYRGTPIAQFNHIFWGTQENHFAGWDERLDKIFCLAEIGCGEVPGGYSSGTNLQGKDHGANPENSEGCYNEALIAGWHVAPSIGIDNQVVPNSQWSTRHTGIWVDRGSGRKGVVEALRKRRVFASEDVDASLKFTCQREGESELHWMGEVLQYADTGISLDIELDDPNGLTGHIKECFDYVDLMCPGLEKPVRQRHSPGKEHRHEILELTADEVRTLPQNGQKESCVYVRARQRGYLFGQRDFVYSAPIWIRQAPLERDAEPMSLDRGYVTGMGE